MSSAASDANILLQKQIQQQYEAAAAAQQSVAEQQAQAQRAQAAAFTIAVNAEGFACWIVHHAITAWDQVRWASWMIHKAAKPLFTDGFAGWIVYHRGLVPDGPHHVEAIVAQHNKPHPHRSLLTRRKFPL